MQPCHRRSALLASMEPGIAEISASLCAVAINLENDDANLEVASLLSGGGQHADSGSAGLDGQITV